MSPPSQRHVRRIFYIKTGLIDENILDEAISREETMKQQVEAGDYVSARNGIFYQTTGADLV